MMRRKARYRRWTTLLLLLVAMITAAGCGGDKSSTSASAGGGMAPASLAAKIMETLEFSDEMLEISDEVVARQYGIDMALIESSAVYVVSSGAVADEVAVLRVKDQADAGAVLALLEKRVETVMDRFVDYLPDEVPKIENARVKQKGDMLLLVIHADVETAGQIFEDNA